MTLLKSVLKKNNNFFETYTKYSKDFNKVGFVFRCSNGAVILSVYDTQICTNPVLINPQNWVKYKPQIYRNIQTEYIEI